MRNGNGENKKQKRLYSVPEAAVYLDISPRKAWELVWGNEIPYVPIGRLVKLDQRDLDLFIERQKTGGRFEKIEGVAGGKIEPRRNIDSPLSPPI
jgi:excisionase family DNA binding protein